MLTAIERGRKSFDLPEKVTLTEAGGVAWYTPLLLTAGDEQLPVLIGPAVVHKERWVVPVLESFDRDETARQMRRESLKSRTAKGYQFGNAPALVSS